MKSNSSRSFFSDKMIVSLLCDYGIFHKNIVNEWIHMIWVPILDFSLLGLLHHFTFHWNPFEISNIFEINLPLIIAILLNLVYITIELPSGVYNCVLLLKSNHYLRSFPLGSTWSFVGSIVHSIIKPLI